LRKLAVVLGHLAFVVACYATWAMGQQFAPELIGAQVVIYPMIMGVAGFWIWYGFWSASVFLDPGRGGRS
jgi:hypothetical protein